MSPGWLILWKQHTKFCIYIHLLNLLDRNIAFLREKNQHLAAVVTSMGEVSVPYVTSQEGDFNAPEKMEGEEVKNRHFSYEITDKLKMHRKAV